VFLIVFMWDLCGCKCWLITEVNKLLIRLRILSVVLLTCDICKNNYRHPVP